MFYILSFSHYSSGALSSLSTMSYLGYLDKAHFKCCSVASPAFCLYSAYLCWKGLSAQPVSTSFLWWESELCQAEGWPGPDSICLLWEKLSLVPWMNTMLHCLGNNHSLTSWLQVSVNVHFNPGHYISALLSPFNACFCLAPSLGQRIIVYWYLCKELITVNKKQLVIFIWRKNKKYRINTLYIPLLGIIAL